MNKINHVLNNERGFLLLNVIFLTLITSFAAMILLNAVSRVRNSNSTLQLTALHLADEQFAQLESLAAAGESLGGSYPFQGDSDDLTSTNYSTDAPTTFDVETHVSGVANLRDVKIKITWTVGKKNFELETERTIRIVQTP